MSDLSAALLPLRARFMEVNAERSAELAILSNRLKHGTESRASLIAIGEIAHKIAGVAETLGFSQIGQLALDLDKRMIALRKAEIGEAQAWAGAEPVLDQLIDAMSD